MLVREKGNHRIIMSSTTSQTNHTWHQYLLGSCAAVLLSALPAGAAERVVFKYGPIARSVPVSSLRQLADTGRAPADLKAYLELADQDPQKVSETLTRPFAISPTELDRLLNSPIGDVMLDEAGEIVHPPSDRANREAIRSALVLDASRDGEITILDTLENYPTDTVEVEGERLLEAYQKYGPVIAKAKQFAPAVGAASPLLKEAAPFLEEASPFLREAQPYLQRSGALNILTDTIRSLLE
ncbi:alpha/beta hydrolase [Acaryochloris sp. IP29b_bin.148]|uniref:alpha/beta hydrolase n=1 Tax=Acaryochloris sp. IP29b_bin.148 TaxID=2969218 RepID=UPI002604B983|nr:alpha/beta hydrolase [Acaryochloris sp. IP29b_bin.148]